MAQGAAILFFAPATHHHPALGRAAFFFGGFCLVGGWKNLKFKIKLHKPLFLNSALVFLMNRKVHVRSCCLHRGVAAAWDVDDKKAGLPVKPTVQPAVITNALPKSP